MSIFWANNVMRSHGFRGVLLGLLTFGLAFTLRMLEWPSWQDAEYRLGPELLLATHDTYHWVAGAEGFEFGFGHPMSEMLRILALLFHTYPAAVAFWFPAVLASLVAVTVYAWVWALGSMEMGVAAGVLTSLAPGFLARTLLGYYDTDLVTLFFPLVMTLAPACWAMRFLLLPQMILRELAFRSGIPAARALLGTYSAHAVPQGNPLTWQWLLLLAFSGIVSWWTLEWHSMFPYLTRYNICLLLGLSLTLAPPHRRGNMVLGALAYAMPTFLGLYGLAIVPVIFVAQIKEFEKLLQLLTKPWTLVLLWGAVGVMVLNAEVFQTMMTHVGSYLKQNSDITMGTGGSALAYPSVAQSIIEVQDLAWDELLLYFHPWQWAAGLGLLGFVWVVVKRPGALFLVPLAVLGLLSMKMGGRMVMFGAPIAAVGLTLPAYWILQRVIRNDLRGFWSSMCVSGIMLAVLAAPFAELIPAMTQGPMLNRRHAEALLRARTVTPQDAILWLWWDWGYAAHHFSHRKTIADGAAHGGPSLYLPAAVFATDNFRFARQLIKYTALHGNDPGNVFEGLDNVQADALIKHLQSAETPLFQTSGKQYVVVSFEMLRLGFWITTFGRWDFIKKEGKGSALSIVPQQLSYRLDNGEVQVHGNTSSIFAASISVFEDGKMTNRNYIQDWFDANQKATVQEQKQFLEKRRNVHFLFNRVTEEKMIVDESLYNTVMVQLLVSPPNDKRFSEYFKLVYDNMFVRIYEVQ
ncbi:MAG: STT3 domain-containing protein [Desulfovibrionaceae bacterium]